MAYQFENVKLEKGMYREGGRSFTETLEQLDPGEAYKGTALEGMDAFQRQLKRFDIKVRGGGSDVVEKFFTSSQAAVLFPEYVARSVKQGMEEANALSDILATTTHINGMDYRSIITMPEEEDKQLHRVEEGAAIPATTIQCQENLVHLHKRGRMLVASYEAVRYQKLDLFSVTLRQIGAHIARTQMKDAVNALMYGDGSNGPAEVHNVASSGTLTYDDLVNLWSKFDSCEMNTMLVPNDVMLQMLKLEEFQNPLAGMNFQGTGKLTTPLGAKLIRTGAMPEGYILGLDKRYALEMVKNGDITVEYDKLIDRQLERAAITSITGFAKIFCEASQVLKV